MSPRLPSVPATWRVPVLALLLATACVWPARESAVLGGVPLTVLGLACCLAIALAIVLRPRQLRAWMLPAALALVAARIAIVPFILPTGWAARYYANDQFQGAFEPSIDFHGQPWTRLERELRFEANTFPLHFLNELRYNFAPDRRTPPISAQFTGVITLDAPRTLQAAVATVNGVELSVDGQTAIAKPVAEPGLLQRTADVPLTAGVHRVDVRFVASSATARKLDVTLRLIDPSRGGAADVSPRVRPIATTSGQELRSRMLGWLLVLVDLLVIGVIVVWSLDAWRSWWRAPARMPTMVTTATLVTLAVWGLVLFVIWQGVPTAYASINSGFDAVAYSEYARKGAMGDWLLLTPSTSYPLDDHMNVFDKAVFYTVGYPLLMSAAHLLFGESLWRVLFVQEWLAWLTVCLATGAALRIAGWRAALATFVVAAYVNVVFFWPAVGIYRENLVAVTNAAVVFLFVSRTPFTPRRAALAGAVAGVNFLTDPINLFAVPILIWLVYKLADPTMRRRSAQMFAIVWLAVAAVVPLRNAAASGVPTPMPTEGPPTMWHGNRPPPDVYPSPPPGKTYMRAIWTYVTTEPRQVITGLVIKASFAFGVYTPLFWRWEIYTQVVLAVVLIWICSLLGVRPAIRQHLGAVVIALLVLIRWGSIVVFLAQDRYVLTNALLMAPFAGIGLALMWQWRPLAVAVVILAAAGDHYLKGSTDMGVLTRWPAGRVLGSASYATMRRGIEKTLAPDTRVRWTFPADTKAWTPGPGVAVIDDETPTFQMLKNDEGVITSPALAVPAALVEAIEIEAGFSGFAHYARVAWHRTDGVSTSTFLRIDHTGRIKTYRIPIWQSRAWSGTINKIEIAYDSDAFEPRRIELVTYPDVSRRGDVLLTAATP